MKELQEESDRGAALIGGDYLDHLVKAFFKSRMNEAKTSDSGKEKISSKLFKYGALSKAATCVDLAHALGWIGPMMYADLVTIRRIRNKFAHSHVPLRFKDEEIGQLCSGLHSLRFSRPYRLARNRDKFLAGVCFLTIQLVGLTAHGGRPGLGLDPNVERLDPSTLDNL